MKHRYGFTMIELVFVIVVLGILAAIAVPRFAATRDDADIAKGRSDVSAIRSAIVNERQTRLLKGDSKYTSLLDDGTTGSGQSLFDGNSSQPLLQYPIISGTGNGHWTKTGTRTYALKIMDQPVNFTYDNTAGTFTCNRAASGNEGLYCSKLID